MRIGDVVGVAERLLESLNIFNGFVDGLRGRPGYSARRQLRVVLVEAHVARRHDLGLDSLLLLEDVTLCPYLFSSALFERLATKLMLQVLILPDIAIVIAAE